MIFTHLLQRFTTLPAHQQETHAGSSELRRPRNQRARCLIQALRRERDAHSACTERKNKTIAALQESIAQESGREFYQGRSSEALQQDLDVALQLLDEFEEAAMESQRALAQIDNLKAEARLSEMAMVDLESELAQWRDTVRSVA